MHDAIFDTNVFVAAGFKRQSACARLIRMAREGQIRLIWDATTRAESERVVRKIPPIDWQPFADLFLPANAWSGSVDLAGVGWVEDPEDRKFAALSLATGATLVSADHHLLDHADRLDVVRPGPFLQQIAPG